MVKRLHHGPADGYLPDHRHLPRLLHARAQDDELFAVIDAARDPEILENLMDLQDEHEIRSLFQGETASILAEVAPYLAQVPANSRLESWLLRHGWAQAWCIFARSQQNIVNVRRHFRKLTMVENESGEQWMFRFYDPRVLREFLLIAERSQLRQIFGELDCILLESEEGRNVIEYRLNADGDMVEIKHTIRNGNDGGFI